MYLKFIFSFLFLGIFGLPLDGLASNCNPILIQGTITKVNNCGNGPNGAIEITISGGTSPYTFAWSNGDTTQNINGLAVGSYGVSVTDAQGCVGNLGFTVDSVAQMVLTDVSTYSSCSGNLGTGAVSIQGGNPPYTFAWSNGTNDSLALNLNPGMYTVIVTDATGCQDSLEVEMENSPPLQVYPIPVHVECADDLGSVTLFIVGGTPAYQINWNGIDSTAVPTGTHSVTVVDASGCQKDVNYTILSNPEIEVEIVKDIVNCDSNFYHVQANINGGNPPYTLSWSVSDTTKVIGGNYQLTVKDASNCEKEVNFSVDASQPLTISHTYTPVTCVSTSTAVTLSISGGVQPYKIEWPDGTQNIYTHNVSLDSTEVVKITDDRGCLVEYPLNIVPAQEISVNMTINEATCGLGNGKVTYTIQGGGSSNYTVKVNGEIKNTYVLNLDTGFYNFEITEPTGCSYDTSFTITNRGGIEIIQVHQEENECFGDNNGVISIKAMGEELTYQWSNGETTSSINDLVGGNYSLRIKDKYDCIFDTNFYVSPGNKIGVTFVENYDPCVASTGSLTALANNGIPPFTYKWTTEDDKDTELSDSTFLFIEEPGKYTVFITDSIGCNIDYTFEVKGDPLGGKYCFKAPTGFSPNGDGINDEFEILGVNLYPKNELQIFNRWGHMVFEKYNYQGDWDGTIEGEPLEAGSYYYVLKLNNPENTIIQNSLTIKR
jgi:gliding motility-associated-like protein